MNDFDKYNLNTKDDADDGNAAPVNDPCNKQTIDTGTNSKADGGESKGDAANVAQKKGPWDITTKTTNDADVGKIKGDDGDAPNAVNAAQKKGPWDITTKTTNDGAGENDGKKDSGHKNGGTSKHDRDSKNDTFVDGRYTKRKYLGRGGMGVVYLCMDNNDRTRDVVLKCLPDKISKDKVRNEELKDNFRNVRELSHPNIAKVIDCVTDSEGKSFLVMEYVAGMDLKEWCWRKREDERKRFSLEGVRKRVSLDKAELTILRGLAEAMDYAHGEDVIHRDLKPSNVMVIEKYGKLKVKVIDFGIAEKIYDSTRPLREYYGRSGTPAYMSPEQLGGEAQGAETDQYSLAVIAYEMLSGHLPFNPADSKYHFDYNSDKTFKETVKEFADAVRDENNKPEPIEGLPSSVNAALLRALSKKPSDRFASCTEFVNALAPHEDSEGDHVSVGDSHSRGKSVDVLEQHETPVEGSVSVGDSHSRGKPVDAGRRYTRRIVVGAVVAVLLAVAAFFVTRGGAPSQSSSVQQSEDTVVKQSPTPINANGAAKGPQMSQKGEAQAQTSKTPEESVKTPEPPPDMSQIKKEVFSWQAFLKDRKPAIDSKNYDRGQTFGEHLDSLKDNYEPAKQAMMDALSGDERFRLVHPWYKKAVEEVEWINRNAPLRENAKALLKEVEEARKKATDEDADKLAVNYYDFANNQLTTANNSFEEGKFQTAINSLVTAKASFNQAFKVARAANIKTFLLAGNNALKEKQWAEAARYADRILAKDADNAEAKKLKRGALIGMKIASGYKALKDNEFDKARRIADEILAEDPKNEEARQLKIDAFVGKLDLNGVPLKMIRVKAGSFKMGDSEYFTRNVILTEDYWLGETEVTQEQWKALMKKNPSWFQKSGLMARRLPDYDTTQYPVENVSYEDVNEFCKKLNSMYAGKLPPKCKFSLPTEAQWEFAARGGNMSRGYTYSGSNTCSEVAWYYENSGASRLDEEKWDVNNLDKYKCRPHPVRGRAPNELGFYDMSGNVSEWCRDWYEKDLRKAAVNPLGPKTGLTCVVRGGNWVHKAGWCLSTERFDSERPSKGCYSIGFRLALVPVTENYPREEYDFNVRLSSSDEIQMLWVQPGDFTMGSPAPDKDNPGEPGRKDDEQQHNIRLTKGFWLGRYEITHGQWKELMGTDLQAQAKKTLEDDTIYIKMGDKTIRDNYGMTRDADPKELLFDNGKDVAMYWLSYDDCIDFCNRLTEREQKAGRLPLGYRYSLPTEAQWEYACRAGKTTALYNGPIEIKGEHNAPSLDEIAWYGGNSSQGYVERGWNTEAWKEKQYPGGIAGVRNVGEKKANQWGFHDMLGNVWEWCFDWYGNYTGDGADPTGAKEQVQGVGRVLRGGCWRTFARYVRAADRNSDSPLRRDNDYGFRLALVPVQ
ncbi:MAG: SUMF1/EgtB/PvdO family nonheme iron enzyme [Victivallales bacterium]|nr:SUMF1/EgtB/PvdO family nonheme iron enzyme [Victivallales bacterium]